MLRDSVLQKTPDNNREVGQFQNISKGNANPCLCGVEADSLICKGICQAQLIHTQEAQRGKEQGGIQRSFRKNTTRQRKAAPSAPADPAPTAVCQHLARGTSNTATSTQPQATGGLQGPLHREKQQEGQEAKTGQRGRC